MTSNFLCVPSCHLWLKAESHPSQYRSRAGILILPDRRHPRNSPRNPRKNRMKILRKNTLTRILLRVNSGVTLGHIGNPRGVSAPPKVTRTAKLRTVCINTTSTCGACPGNTQDFEIEGAKKGYVPR